MADMESTCFGLLLDTNNIKGYRGVRSKICPDKICILIQWMRKE